MRLAVVIAVLLVSLSFGNEIPEDVALAERFQIMLTERCAHKLALGGALLASIPARFLAEIFDDRAGIFLKEKSLLEYVTFFDFWTQGKLPENTNRFFEPELQNLSRLFSMRFYGGGGKDRTETWYGDVHTQKLRDEIFRVVQEQWKAAPGDRKPLRFRIVGLGWGNGEYGHLVRWLGPMFDALDGPGKRTRLAEQLSVRFHLYDVNAELLESVEREVARTEVAEPWLKGRTRVSYANLVVDEWFEGWGEENTVLVMTRNSMREELMNRCRGFMESAGKCLVDNGLLILGPREDNYLRTVYCYLYPFHHAGTLGLGIYEENAEIFRRSARYRPPPP